MSTIFGAKNAEEPSKALLFFNYHPLPTFLVNRSNLKIISANKAASLLLQLSAQELVRLIFTDFLIPADKIKTLAVLQRSTEEAPWNTIVQIQRPSQEILTAEMHVQTLITGDEVLHQITLIDITSRYAKQEQLAATAKRYKGFIDQNTEGIYCQDLKVPVPVTAPIEVLIEAIQESVLTECNDAMAQMYGYEFGSQMVGAITKDLIDLSDESNVEYLKKFINSDFKIISAESHEKDRFGNSVFFLNNAIGIVEEGILKRIWGTQRDITHIKQVEKKVRLLADLVEQTSDVLTASDLEYKPITWNAAAEKVYGLTAQQVIGKNIRQYIDIHYNNATRDEVRAAINTEGGWRGEMSFIRPTDQKLVTLLTGFKLMKDENNQPLGYIISGTDITERKEAEAQIRLLASLVHNTSDVLIAVDLNFKTISWNGAAERLSGIKADQIVGKHFRELLEINFNDYSSQEVKAILREKGEWRGEMYFIRPSDKEKITLIANYKLFQDTGGVPVGYIIACTEITARKEAELMLRESESHFRELA
ncbi:MAG TPA: PAS domain-containing protein, partial [Flavisolibacter sp.]|nr:PAS domain-containing protein [Flavisolibacter sp.]